MKTTVVHCKRNVYDTYIGRPSKWGNPFVIGPDGDRLQVIEKYREWIFTQPKLLADLNELRGKRLGCWCSPAICHGNVLAELADINTGPALWHCKDYDYPVDITGIMGLGNDGRIYLRTVYGCGVPLDEVKWQ
jgi:hypothetical protein